jgi:hypothetical protein
MDAFTVYILIFQCTLCGPKHWEAYQQMEFYENFLEYAKIIMHKKY